MNIPHIILGVAMICVGIYIVILQIKWFKKGLKDTLGSEIRLLITGIGLIVIGIIIIVKAFTG